MRPDSASPPRAPAATHRIRAVITVVTVVLVSAALVLTDRLRDDAPPPSADPTVSASPTARAPRANARPTTRSTPRGDDSRVAATGPAVFGTKRGADGFVHPGILVTVPQLESVRSHIRAREEPWTSAFDAMARNAYADLAWTPKPRAVVECGSFSVPNLGCDDESRDAVAVYTHALLWYLTGRPAHARKAADILDAWATVLQGHRGANAPIQAAWSAASFVRGAEILRYTYPDWSGAERERTTAMLQNVFRPAVADGGAPGTWGNWDLIILSAAQGIAVYLDDRGLFDQVANRWRARVPAYIYLYSDGPFPVGPPGGPSGARAMVEFWFNQATYVEGLTQETCRDLGHTGWGLEAMAQIAETAWIQGLDLYGEAQSRLVAALELHAALAVGEPVPGWLCGGLVTAQFGPLPELALNHYAQRRGVAMPFTTKLVSTARPQGASFFYGWETLTHGSRPN